MASTARPSKAPHCSSARLALRSWRDRNPVRKRPSVRRRVGVEAPGLAERRLRAGRQGKRCALVEETESLRSKLEQEMLGEHITHLTLNKDVCCSRHKDGRNAGPSSHITFFGPEGAEYTGRELVLEEEGGHRVLSEHNVWHTFDGRNTWHYNRPHIGTKFSVVAGRFFSDGGVGPILHCVSVS